MKNSSTKSSAKSLNAKFADNNTQSELAESDVNFKNILTTLNVNIFISDPQTFEVLYCNNEAQNLFGDISKKKCWQLLSEDQTKPCHYCLNKSGQTDFCNSKNEIRYEVKSTIYEKWYDVHEQFIDLDNEKKAIFHFISDITESKEIENELLEYGGKYRTIADYTYDWECWFNENKRLEYISPSCERITGYRPNDFLSDPNLLHNIIFPEDRLAYNDLLNLFFHNQYPCHLEFRIISKSGQIRWISLYSQAVYDKKGNFIGRRSSNRDITEKKRDEKKKKLDEQRLALLVRLYEIKELNPDGLFDFVLESSLTLTSSSIGFVGLINKDQSLLTIRAWSKNVLKQCSVYKDTVEFNIQKAGLWGVAIQQKKPFLLNDFSLDSPFKKGLPEGHVPIQRFLAVPLVDDKKAVLLIGVGNKESDYTDDDITQLQPLLSGMWQILQRKRAEEELLTFSKRVKHFASVIAHDLKSPAISIHGFTEMLKRKYKNDLDDRALGYCEQILKCANQISSLAENINTYVSTQDTLENFESLKLDEILNTVRQEFAPQFEEREINWTTTNINDVHIIANRIGLIRIFRNLIDNALKYGGADLSQIILSYEKSGSHHVLSIANDGIKIDENESEIIFEEFKRNAKNSKIFGTGLGLSIVKEITKKHKGQAWLTHSTAGNPTFCVSIFSHLKTEI